jgi:two-component system sensor histidine kinase KdpD
MSQVAGHDFLINSAGNQLGEILDAEIAIYVRESDGRLTLRFGKNTSIPRHEVNNVVADWVAGHDETAGAGTDTLPNASALFVPLIGSQRTLGAIGIKTVDPDRVGDPEQRRMAETCAGLVALSLERDQSVLEAAEAELRYKTEQLRSSLLSSVSHDLRTPLATIAGSSSTLLQAWSDLDSSIREEMLHTILSESRRLARLVDNLLEMTRLESGSVVPNRQWQVLEEIVGSALARLRRELKNHTVRVEIPADFPLLRLDGTLIEQVLVNLLENAARHTPAGSQIEIRARATGREIEIAVRDNGLGLPAGSESRIFEKFYRATPASADGRRGVGLGLSICRAIVLAHGGTIVARNRPEGGAEFIIHLPQEEEAPPVPADTMSAASET